jgi:hypothetical protein
MWVVVVDGHAYVRSAFGLRSAWYRSVEAGCRTEVRLGHAVWPVRLTSVDADALNEHISSAYRAKYAAAWPGPTATMVGTEALATTMRVEFP